VKKKTSVLYLELNLGNSIGSAGKLSPGRLHPGTELETLRILKRAAADKKLKGIFINTSGFSANRGYLWELQNILEICKSLGKKIVAYFDSADLDLYWFLTVADKIIMDVGGMLNFLGYSWGRFFAKESLDKLGIGFRELRYLDYKSAYDTFSRTTISETDREQYGAYLDDIFDLSKAIITHNRAMNEEDFNTLLKEGVILSPTEAKNRNLVDAIGREETIKETIKGLEFKEGDEGKLNFISAGNPAFSFFNQSQKTSRYTAKKARGIRLPEIAVINARGVVDLEQGIEARNVSRLIRRLAEKPRVKALVVRIDSPGGSAVAADFIAEAIAMAKKKIPVVVSFGDVAASGGYWAAMYASHIMASPYALTGSIGVIGSWFFDKGLNAKLGLDFEALTRGEHADLGTGFILPKRDLSADEEERFRRCILDLYGEFVKKAALGRNKKEEELETLARGRVYSGLTSQRLGLTDSLGGYLDALETARDLAGIPVSKKLKIKEYPKPKFFEKIVAKAFSKEHSANPLLHILGVPRLWDDLYYRFSQNGKVMPILPCFFLTRNGPDTT